MANTAAKKNVVDYLWDWAESQAEWARILVQLVVTKEDDLDDEERRLVYAWFQKGTGIRDEAPPFQIKRPAQASSASEIELISLGEIFGVNRLASHQTLSFSENLTVIYGENGSGKTGYGRVLKKLGTCYDAETHIHPNIFIDSECSQCAAIKYRVSSEEHTFTWCGSNQCADLQGIQFFNNACVHFSLDGKRDLLVMPMGFRLFEIVSMELGKLMAMHRDDVLKLEVSIAWLGELHKETTSYLLASSLSKDTTDEQIEEATKFSEKHERALAESITQLKGLNKKLLQSEIDSCMQQINELQTVKNRIETTRQSFKKEDFEAYVASLRYLAALRGREKVGLKEIAEARGIEGWESSEFVNFLRAAEVYLGKIELGQYPESEDAVCIFCRQPLSDPAALDLIRRYRAFLADTTQQEIKKTQASLLAIQKRIGAMSQGVVLHQSTYGMGENGQAVQPSYLLEYNSAIKEFVRVCLEQDLKVLSSLSWGISFDAAVLQIDEKLSALEKTLGQKRKDINSIVTKEAALNKIINDLSDRKKLSEKKKDILFVWGRKKLIALMESVAGVFSSDPISRRTSRARSALVEEQFQAIFEHEMKCFRRSTVPISLGFRTEKGQSKLVQNIKKYRIDEILSEGEQKSIALAEFLTELQLDKSKTPVIFDDPVTSLDHKIIEEVARRLLSLSKERQVAIFTHSILLFNSIKQLSQSPLHRMVRLKCYEVQKDDTSTGLLAESMSPKDESFAAYKKRINEILNLPVEEKRRRQEQLATEGYGKLRAAIEVLVEKHILHDIVKRYQRNVAVTNFEKVNTSLIEEHRERLCAIFSRACSFIDGHTNPDEIPDKPDLEGLKIDFQEVLGIQGAFAA